MMKEDIWNTDPYEESIIEALQREAKAIKVKDGQTSYLKIKACIRACENFIKTFDV